MEEICNVIDIICYKMLFKSRSLTFSSTNLFHILVSGSVYVYYALYM